MSNRVDITCSNLTLDTGGRINASFKGYKHNQGLGAGSGTWHSGGGGHGGVGGFSSYEYKGGKMYGSASAPVHPGSGGGGSDTGGSEGGGAVMIDADGTVEINGLITADGSNGTHYAYGGGAGGSIYITCDTFKGSVSGLLRANGGRPPSGGTKYSGAGGGGRIAVNYQNLGSPAAVRFSTANGPTGYAEAYADRHAYYMSDWGTVWLPDTQLVTPFMASNLFNEATLVIPGFSSWSPSSLTISNCSFELDDPDFSLTVANELKIYDGFLAMGGTNGNASLDCGDLTLESGGELYVRSGTNLPAGYGVLVNVAGDVSIGSACWIYPYSHPTNGGSMFLQATNVTIAAGGGIEASSRGYKRGLGPGAGGGTHHSGGAGHGGRGGEGNNTSFLRGGTYGSITAPTQPGSGGGGADYAGYGGGLVRIDASESVTVSGTVKAKGGRSIRYGEAGGSGGSIYITCDTFGGEASGLLSVEGGTLGESSWHSGGSGGGRIAVDYQNLAATHATRFLASGGYGYGNQYNVPWEAAEAGTVYLPDADILSTVLNDELFTDVHLFLGVSSWSPASLTVSNCAFVIAEPDFQIDVSGDIRIDADGSLGLGTTNGSAALSCGGDLVITNGGMVHAYGGATNVIPEEYGAVVTVGGDIVVGPGSWLTPHSDIDDGGPVLWICDDLLIATNGGFNAKGSGYAASAGPGGAAVTTGHGGGGAYGGDGGSNNSGTGNGLAYGWTNGMLTAGSGGGGRSGRGAGRGGGLVWVEASGSIRVDGIIDADGWNGLDNVRSGGAGGGVWLRGESGFSGAVGSKITADGGDPGGTASVYAGSGGGGRVAIWIGPVPETLESMILLGQDANGLTYTNDYAAFLGDVSVTNGVINGTPIGLTTPGTVGSYVFVEYIPPPEGTLILVR